MKKEDFSKMTELELLDLRRDINEEIDKYSNRDKIKVCKISKAFEGSKYFLEKENALDFLNKYWLSDKEELFEEDSKIEIDVTFLTNAEAEAYCLDFKKITIS